jgi:hypothetical protein
VLEGGRQGATRYWHDRTFLSNKAKSFRCLGISPLGQRLRDAGGVLSQAYHSQEFVSAGALCDLHGFTFDIILANKGTHVSPLLPLYSGVSSGGLPAAV